ncbi:hypothetical protein [Dyella silvatica]|uniref:hypothetical protein n=1 Tax=Dyella silvatica TaxID=2992128 RepID=UPI002258F902|nr:hypothetical protein [Dyella silvatica]
MMAFFGTGELLAQGDLTSTNTQSFYGVFDNTSDLSNYPSGSVPAPPYTRSNLQQQTVTAQTVTISGTSSQALTSSNNPVNLTYAPISVTNSSAPPATVSLNPQEGWYFDLSSVSSGARSYTISQVENGGVVFTINIPPTSSCAQPASYLMNVNYLSGGPFSQPSIGLAGGLSIGTATLANGTTVNITGTLVGQTYSAAPTTAKSGSGSNVQIISTAQGLTVIPTIGHSSSRVGWWQIK